LEYSLLGQSALKVSRICFGALTIGPTQRNLSIREGSEIISYALRSGINFIDTAKSYGTYAHISRALASFPGSEIIVASKSHAWSRKQMQEDVEDCLRQLKRDVIDIFLLHEQESRLTLAGHRPALDYLLAAKEKGFVRAVGISTHAVEAVEAAAEMEEIDVIHPLINKRGIGLLDGSRDMMLDAIKKASSAGKGIYSMKPLGGGLMIPQAREALRWVLDNPHIDSAAVGMQSRAEIDTNVAWSENRQPDRKISGLLASFPRQLLISDWCQGCGKCAARCGLKAITVVENKALVDKNKCVLCGYCAAVCRDFCIKII